MIHYESIQHEVSQLNTSQAFTQELLAICVKPVCEELLRACTRKNLSVS